MSYKKRNLTCTRCLMQLQAYALMKLWLKHSWDSHWTHGYLWRGNDELEFKNTMTHTQHNEEPWEQVWEKNRGFSVQN